ncbi:anaerobic sulfatase maturase [Plasticicumulans acidivorans]|uniref:Radical SAM core domain-containing protein n=1 Tax=Plasticicumulans acidivorans TaxID=886464 RepID=A0A317MZF5_9GAMM|nr:anaerobic sulfatase maturase [Plasticicumulans acidivorans]PWV65597.1 uncharacterized protein C7443_10181 [Plasticicumulans acidivorans]
MTTPPIKPLADPPLHLPALANGDVYRFHTMVKPSGAQCNLDCAYCFYLHKEDLLQQPKMPRMDEDWLETHIRQYIAAQTGREVIFSWQGGEPTLMGLEFFRRVVALQQQYKKPGQRIENDLQTNGILLDDEWCAFLHEQHFLVGLSIDGPAELHDHYRYSKGHKPTHERVMHAVALLHKHQVEFSALCVVNRLNARRPIDVYRFIRDQVRPRMIQLIPGLEPGDFRQVAPGHWNWDALPVVGTPQARPGHPDSVVADWSVDPDDWGYFLGRVWDEWFKRDFGRVFIDQFENVVSMMLGNGSQKCVTSPVCGKALAIEHNGDLYSCDHFVYPEYRLGNIGETHEGDLAFSEQQQQFGYAKRNSLPQYCRECRYLQLCWGECPKNRFVKTPDGEPGLNYLCRGLKAFYAKATGDLSELHKRLGKH